MDRPNQQKDTLTFHENARTSLQAGSPSPGLRAWIRGVKEGAKQNKDKPLHPWKMGDTVVNQNV